MPTILELFQNSTLSGQVKPDRLTGVEQEVTGIRIKSAVEINNPLIYGTDTFRIANRSTKMKDKMIELRNVGADGGTDATDGAIQKGIKSLGKSKFAGKVKDKFNKFKESKVGQNLSKIVGKPPGDTNPSSILEELKSIDNIQLGYPKALSDLKGDLGGSGLLQSGLPTGNPRTAAQQAAGKVLDKVKSEIRGALFGSPAGMGTNNPDSEFTKTYNPGIGSYTQVNDENSDGLTGDGSEETNLSKYASLGDRVAALKVGFNNKLKITNKVERNVTSKEDLTVDIVKDRDERIRDAKDELSVAKGFSNTDDVINQSGIYKGGTDKETAIKHELDTKDFIPLYFRNIVTGETVHFRGTITGLSETVSPTWDSAKFAGNPFNFYTYTGIERSVTFNFTIYPMNSAELANNWTKIEFLTSLAYPLGYQSGDIGSVRAPIVYFTMGDLYKDRVSFIDSLQYTIPDNSNWQLDGKQKDYESSEAFFSENGGTKVDVDKGYKLPHLVEVAISLKFLEQRNNTEDRTKLYSFKSITY
tara:strand:+ start:924 stop:2510 length:1587 start_codon:yes stop_codon:yes gene_type:complete